MDVVSTPLSPRWAPWLYTCSLNLLTDNTLRRDYLRDSLTGYFLSRYIYGGISFSCHVSIFSLFQIVKEQYRKPDSQVSFTLFSDTVFHSVSAMASPRGFEPLLPP